jgi:hypothetical protein
MTNSLAHCQLEMPSCVKDLCSRTLLTAPRMLIRPHFSIDAQLRALFPDTPVVFTIQDAQPLEEGQAQVRTSCQGDVRAERCIIIFCNKITAPNVPVRWRVDRCDDFSYVANTATQKFKWHTQMQAVCIEMRHPLSVGIPGVFVD